jgi:CheY-like chemotaxis protein
MRSAPGGRPQILLVEDSAADVRLLREALRSAGTPCDLYVAVDGEQGLAALRDGLPGVGGRDGAGVGGPARADLVLLDLNLPRKGGLELLDDIRADPVLRLLPVIVLTTSRADRDVRGAYARGANCYIVKPVDFDQFREVVDAIERLWLRVAVLPPNGSPRAARPLVPGRAAGAPGASDEDAAGAGTNGPRAGHASCRCSERGHGRW